MQTLDANKMDGSGAVSILIYCGGAEGLCYIKELLSREFIWEIA